MKKILLILAFLSHVIYSQTYTVTEKQIEVTSTFYNSYILEMNSGTTVLLQMEPRIEGFLLKIYDNQHEERIFSKIKYENIKDINSVRVVNFIELNQRANLFYLLAADGSVTLNKLEIEQYTGEYKNEIIFTYKLPENMGWNYTDFNFFKVIENQTKDKYAVIIGTTEVNKEYKLNITSYNSITNKILCKHTQALNNCFKLELMDAAMDDENVFLGLNKKERPKDSETVGWWVISEINYVPANKISVMKLNTNSKTTAIVDLELENIIYSTKAQFTLDNKNNQLNLLLSCINPQDKYWKIPDSKTIFYKFSKSDLAITTERKMTNEFAFSKSTIKYVEAAPDKSAFANFPKFMFTDPEGNNTFLFQTIYNKYRSLEGGSDMIKSEFAVLYSNSDVGINDVKFSPYYFTTHGHLNGGFDEYAFDCNNYIKPSHPRYDVFDKEYFNYKVFETGSSCVIISNILPKNADKNLGDKFYPNNHPDMMTSMIHVINKDNYSYKKVLEGEEYKKLKFNLNISSFNSKTKTFSVLATELKGTKERLVWIKFE